MRQLLHNIRVRVLEKDKDEIDGIKDVFKELLPADFKKENICINHEKAEGFNEKTIHILSMKTNKKRHNWLLLENIFKNLSKEERGKIYKQRHTRLDEQGNFFIRLDKKSLLNNSYELIEHGDCFHFKIGIAAFPSKKENIVKSLEKIFQKLNEK